MRLFEFKNYKLTIADEAYLLKPFKVIWDRDKSKNKDKALMELGYVYFFVDPRSDYQYIIDEKERSKAICEGEGISDWFKVDKEITSAIDFYKSFKSMSSLLLDDTRVAIDKVRKFLRDLDLSLLDDKGKPVYSINSITSTIKMIPQLVRDLDEAERAANKEMREDGRMKGGGEKSIFEDDLNA